MNINFSKPQINLVLMVTLLITTFICSFTGIIKLLNLILVNSLLYYLSNLLTSLHDWSGIILVLVSLIHMVNYWKWFIGMTKRLFGSKNLGKNKWPYIIQLLILFSLILTALTGFIKIPLFRIEDPSSILKWIHDRSGFFLLVFSLIHIIQYRIILRNKFKFSFNQVKSQKSENN
jgi:hypothetical protein